MEVLNFFGKKNKVENTDNIQQIHKFIKEYKDEMWRKGKEVVKDNCKNYLYERIYLYNIQPMNTNDLLVNFDYHFNNNNEYEVETKPKVDNIERKKLIQNYKMEYVAEMRELRRELVKEDCKKYIQKKLDMRKEPVLVEHNHTMMNSLVVGCC